MRRTKIVCTIGPASDDLDTLRNLVKAGMDVARLNFSHGVHKEHAERIRNIRLVAREYEKHIPIMLDTKGPELRIGTFESGSITLTRGDLFTITTQPLLGNSRTVSVNYPGMPILVTPGDRLLLDDGQLEMVVRSVKGPAIECEVIVGGILSNRKRVSIPGRQVDLPTLSAEDKRDLAFGIEHGIDIVAASFIRTASSVQEIKSFVESRGASLPVIAKIESREGIENIGSILRFADGLMVARGDLGVNFPQRMFR